MYVGSFFKKENRRLSNCHGKKTRHGGQEGGGGGEGAMGMDGRDGLFLIKVQVPWW